MTKEEKIELIIRRGVQIHNEDSLRKKLNSNKKLIVKFGADPSRPDLHLGHTVSLRLLKDLQDLGHEIENNFSGVLKKNLLNLLYTPRKNNPNPDRGECEKLANLLVDVGEPNWAGDENIFKEVFIQSSPEELVLIGRYYQKLSGHNMLDVIDQKISGKNKALLREILFNYS